MTEMVGDIRERVETERERMETEVNEVLDEYALGQIINYQYFNANDLNDELNKHSENFMSVLSRNSKEYEDIWNVIENQTDALNTLEDKSKKLLYQISDHEQNVTNLNVMEDSEKDSFLLDLDSSVDSLTEKVNSFVKNLMNLRSLPQKVMDIQKKLNKLESKMID